MLSPRARREAITTAAANLPHAAEDKGAPHELHSEPQPAP